MDIQTFGQILILLFIIIVPAYGFYRNYKIEKKYGWPGAKSSKIK